jgi:hypothetical protein
LSFVQTMRWFSSGMIASMPRYLGAMAVRFKTLHSAQHGA